MVRDGVLYHRVFHLDGGKEVLQVSLAVAIESQILTQQHGHQGVEQTTLVTTSWCVRNVTGLGCPQILPTAGMGCGECCCLVSLLYGFVLFTLSG